MREAGDLWLVDTRRNPNSFPELTESGFARMICASRRMPALSISARTIDIHRARVMDKMRADSLVCLVSMMREERA